MSDDDDCTIDLTEAPFLRDILSVCVEGGLSESQAERIGHRTYIIKTLTKVVRETTDDAQRQRASWIIEDKKREIEAIAAEGPAPRSLAAGQAADDSGPPRG